MNTRISASVQPRLLPEADRHVLSRFAYGVDETLVRDALAAGSGLAWFERQLNHTAIDDSAADATLGWFPLLGQSPATRFANRQSGAVSTSDYGVAHVNYWMAHAALTRRHVHEQMVHFWTNLLYIPAFDDRSFPWRFHYEQTIRTNALLSFRTLLKACVKHPAMSGWLNNNENTKQGINENLGRELLELYTVGRAAKYNENHVRDSARLLTGFRTRDGDTLRSWFDPSKHWTGPVTILGFRHANKSADGRAAIDAYLDYLALHPSTANRIARRLCQRFVSDAPPAQIVSAVAQAYLSSKSDIKATLRALVKHPQFAAARRGKVMTPIEDVLSTSRVVGIKPLKPAAGSTPFSQHLVWMASDLGQAPLRWPRPDGFPEVSAAYVSPTRLIQSWLQHAALTADWWKGVSMSRPKSVDLLPTQWPRRLDELVEHQSRMLLGRTTEPASLTAIAKALKVPSTYRFDSASALSDWQLSIIRGTILELPEGLKR